MKDNVENLTEKLSGIDPELLNNLQNGQIDSAFLENGIHALTGWIAGLFAVGMIILLFRQAIEGAVAGMIFKSGAELSYDQPILISGRKARLIRVGLFKTVFYLDNLTDKEPDTRTKLVVPNTQLNQLVLECPIVEHQIDNLTKKTSSK